MQGAWDLFVERYRRLMLATIHRLVPVADDVVEVFATVCQELVADDCARLRRYSVQSERRASVATWLVIVVRNLTIDWLRRRDGRHRVTVPGGLTPRQRAIYGALCVEGHSPVEAYELLRGDGGPPPAFHQFLREVRTLHRVAPCPDAGRFGNRTGVPVGEPAAPPDTAGVETAEAARRIAAALGSQPADVRLAVQLFVVDGLPAAEVARAVGWAGPKTVYNRVYRALAALRILLEAQGIRPGDL